MRMGRALAVGIQVAVAAQAQQAAADPGRAAEDAPKQGARTLDKQQGDDAEPLAPFTDPTFGLKKHRVWKEQPCCGIYKVAPDGEITLVADDFQLPNALAFAPDEKVLYIDDTAAGHIRAFDVSEDGGLSPRRGFCEPKGEGAGGPDGRSCGSIAKVRAYRGRRSA